jgi:hypothetical protein
MAYNIWLRNLRTGDSKPAMTNLSIQEAYDWVSLNMRQLPDGIQYFTENIKNGEVDMMFTNTQTITPRYTMKVGKVGRKFRLQRMVATPTKMGKPTRQPSTKKSSRGGKSNLWKMKSVELYDMLRTGKVSKKQRNFINYILSARGGRWNKSNPKNKPPSKKRWS